VFSHRLHIHLSDKGFLGADKFLEKDGKLKPVSRKRVGIAGMKAPAREHTEIFTADGATKIGEITSGGFGPTVKKPIAMGYVPTAYSKDGTEIAVSIRGKMLPAQITKMPFSTTNYFKPE
jgi:aminomethyltransferase